ncbi:MAG: class I SAM-dependent methyltransferase [Burkholderiales bacterium]
MTGFDADWLALREPADGRARDAALRDAAAAHCARSPGEGPVHVVDLACGTGSTLRALAPRIARAQVWTLVDHDPKLLDRARIATASTGAPVEVRTLEADLDGGLDAVLAIDAALVATSAFLDLVSDDWIARLARGLAARARPFYAALSVDGRHACEPPDPLDAAVFAAFDAHQRRDKGLGAALGPLAAQAAADRLAEAGHVVRTAPADWVLDAARPGDAALLAPLLDGWVRAVAETGLVPAAALDAWHARRRTELQAGSLRARVGHLDLWATPRAQRAVGSSTSQSTSSPSA